MTLLDKLHEQYESEGQLVVFRCQECGYATLSLGGLHAHIEGHQSTITHFLRMLPLVGPDYVEPLMDQTNILRVDETATIGLEEVEGL